MPGRRIAADSAQAATLRHRAEARVRGAAADQLVGPDEVQRIVHELRVHQIELEMQNEELRRTQVALDTARAKYFDLYDMAPVGYFTINEAGLLTEANLTAATLFGLARNTLVHQPISRFVLKEDQDVYYLHRRQLASGGRMTVELRMQRGDGSAFWAELVSTVAEDPDGAKVQRVIMTDVSDRKRMESAMLEKHAELDRARSIAQSASVAKSEFLSRMSHELRTPLNAVLGFAQLMESDIPPPTPAQKSNLEHILRGGWFLLQLINEILDLSVIESGQLVLAVDAVSLAPVLLDCEAMLGPEARTAGIRLSVRLPPEPCVLSVDRSRLKQILLNLFSNAIKYNRPGGTVDVSCGSPSPGRVRVSVRDTGKGLSAEERSHLFEPFNRLGQEQSNRPGTGIGLVVSRRLAAAMGGEIGVQSMVGVGSTFWVELPAR